MNNKKKSIWTIVLTIAKYAVALALGYVSGDSSVIDSIL